MVKYIIQTNGTQWCYNCWKSVSDGNKIRFLDKAMPYTGNSFMYWLCYTHYRFRSPFLRLLPFTSIWYDNFKRTLNIDKDEDTVLIIYDWCFLTKDFKFLKRIRKEYPRLHIVYLFSNIVKVTGARLYRILDKLNDNFDIVFAFDKEDAKQYHFNHNPLIYTPPTTLPVYSNNLEYDLFYLGQAKDRYEQLIEIYEKACKEGLKCNFTIVGVPKDKRLYEGEISYERMTYTQALEIMGKSKCLVDAIQGGSTALTIKTCEAVVMGRKLITTNHNVLNEPFYKENNILLYKKDVSLKSFIEKPMVNYTESDRMYFSPKGLYQKIEKQLGLKE